MFKSFYCLLLLLALFVPTGCETINDTTTGAATGLGQDAHNLTDPNKNGWNALEKADAWVRENVW